MIRGIIVVCVVCRTRKGKRECLRLSNSICTRCCGTQKNLSECPISCKHLLKNDKEPNFIAKGAMAYSSSPGGKPFRFCDYLFLPNIYSCITLNILNFEISFNDIQSLDIHTEFELNFNSINGLEESLSIDSWKKNFYPISAVENEMNPLIGISSINNGLYSLKKGEINLNPSSDFKVSTTQWIIASPFQRSVIYPVRGPQKPTYTPVNYLFARNLMIFAKLQFNVPYEFDIRLYNINRLQNNDLETNIGLITPFGKTIFGSYGIFESPGTTLEHNCGIFKPVKTDFYPGEKRNAIQFIQCQGNEGTIMGELIDMPINTKTIDECPNLILWQLKSTPQADVLVSVLTHDNILNPRLLTPLLNWIGDIAAPVHIKIVNTSSNTRRFLIKSTEQTTGVVWQDSAIARANTEITVPLHFDGLNNNQPGDSSVNIEVIDNNSIVHTEIVRIRVLPKDHLLLRIHDLTQDYYLDTSAAAVCWITPNDPEIDKWVSNARSNSVSGIFMGPHGDPIPQIEALWDEIEKMGVSYLTRSYSGNFERSSYQRVTIPRDTLNLTSGNCIDLSVLFASALEQLGLEPLIVLLPDHAFIGWENVDGSKGFLETTWINQKSFDYALDDGKEQYEDNEMFFGKENGFNILKVSEERAKGLRPIF